MAIQFDETTYTGTNERLLNEGLDIHVIPQKIPVEKKPSHLLYQLLIMCTGLLVLIPGIIAVLCSIPDDGWWMGLLSIPVALLPSLILWTVKNSTRSYFESLQQSINQAASQVDIYISHRVTLMRSLAKTVDKGLEQELQVLLETAKQRGSGDADTCRNYTNDSLNQFIATVEAYPDIKSNQYIVKLMEEDEKCMSEITAARVLYNDKVGIWNKEIFQWPIKQIIAAESGYTTRIPFIASAAVKTANDDSTF